jgi:hypothetical protein
MHADYLLSGLSCMDEDISAHLGDNVHATVKANYHVVNIRRWYKDDHVLKPCTEGVTLRHCNLEHLIHIKYQIELTIWADKLSKHSK